jgi:hypothetical protein
MYYAYNITIRSVFAIIVTVGKNTYYVFQVCVYRLRYPAPEEYVPYHIVMLPVSHYNIITLYLIKGTF